jgi:hypothetical protein
MVRLRETELIAMWKGMDGSQGEWMSFWTPDGTAQKELRKGE